MTNVIDTINENSDPPVIIVPADIYDYLEFVSEVYGGVGWALWYTDDLINGGKIPVCISGQASFCQEWGSDIGFPGASLLYNTTENDKAVLGREMYESLGSTFNYNTPDEIKYKRIPWQEYCEIRNIVRRD